MVSPTSRLRMVTSEGRTSPITVASRKIGTGAASPDTNIAISAAATAT